MWKLNKRNRICNITFHFSDNYFRLGADQNTTLLIYIQKNNCIKWLDGWFMMLNDTFNNISVISWRSVLLVEETGVPGENHRPVGSH